MFIVLPFYLSFSFIHVTVNLRGCHTKQLWFISLYSERYIFCFSLAAMEVLNYVERADGKRGLWRTARTEARYVLQNSHLEHLELIELERLHY